jgi:hypothetical protein
MVAEGQDEHQVGLFVEVVQRHVAGSPARDDQLPQLSDVATQEWVRGERLDSLGDQVDDTTGELLEPRQVFDRAVRAAYLYAARCRRFRGGGIAARSCVTAKSAAFTAASLPNCS